MNRSALAERLNLRCDCAVVGAEPYAGFFSGLPVFIDVAHVQAMRRVIAAVHTVVSLPMYQKAVLAASPAIAAVEPQTRGVFAGFDFHIAADGPRLIEVNTNAGGAMLNAVADWHHPPCCGAEESRLPVTSRADLELDFFAMFQEEWRLARGDRPLRTIAIVDDQPAQQFLYPEFQLFVELFRKYGIDAFVADAAELEFANGQLSWRSKSIDLVYNRVTDFYLEGAAHSALRAAYESDASVITPHPRAHALFADKRNLARFTDTAFLRSVGADEADIEVLQTGIPQTRLVVDDEYWWRDRKQWFFKPASGFGSRGAYRGDKLTRRVFGDVIKGGYVAQRLALPGVRGRKLEGGTEQFRVDLRHYVYEGRTQLLAARLYQGQTTNFRTAGGGFAPVLELCDDADNHERWQRCLA